MILIVEAVSSQYSTAAGVFLNLKMLTQRPFMCECCAVVILHRKQVFDKERQHEQVMKEPLINQPAGSDVVQRKLELCFFMFVFFKKGPADAIF